MSNTQFSETVEAVRVTGPSDPAVAQALSLIEQGASDREKDRRHPFEGVDIIRRSGLGALRISKAYGGLGASLRDSLDFTIKLAAADPNVAHILRNHFVFVDRYARHSQDGSHESWARLAADGAIFSLASNEPNKTVSGSGGVKSVLTPTANCYVLDTVKIYSTGVYYADYVIVRVVTQDGRPASAIIPTTREGVTRHDDWDGFGQRLTGTGTTEFRHVTVYPHEVVLDSEDNYKRYYSSTHPQLFLTAVVAGILAAVARDGAREIRRRTRSFAHAPTPQPTQDVVLQQTLGEIASASLVAESAVLSAADALERAFDAWEQGHDYRELAHTASLRAAAAKVVIDELAIRGASQLFDLGGASLTVRSLNLDRHWRNARTVASHNPASYKAIAIGRFVLDQTPLPNQAYF